MLYSLDIYMKNGELIKWQNLTKEEFNKIINNFKNKDKEYIVNKARMIRKTGIDHMIGDSHF